MADFIAKIRAELDTSTIKNEIDLGSRQFLLKNVRAQVSEITLAKGGVASVSSAVQAALGKAKFNITIPKATITDIKLGKGATTNVKNQIEKSISGKKYTINLKDVKGKLSEVALARGGASKLTTQVQDALSKKKFSITVDKIKIDNTSLGSTAKQMEKSTQEKLATSIQTRIDTGAIESQISAIELKFEKLGVTGDKSLEGIEENLREISALFGKMRDGDSDDLVADYTELNKLLSTVKNNLATVSNNNKAIASSLQISQFDNQITRWIKDNTKAAKEFTPQMEDVQVALRSLGANVPISELEKLKQKFKEIDALAESAGKKGKTFGDSLKGAFSSLSRYVSISTIIYKVVESFKDMFDQVVKLDTAMTELIKVTNEVDSTYEKFLQNSGSKAKELGTTVDGLISSTADFARLGYSLDDASALAEVANIYAVVGDDIDGVDGATSSLVSTMTAFNLAADEAMNIVDKFNEVGEIIAHQYGNILLASGYIG